MASHSQTMQDYRAVCLEDLTALQGTHIHSTTEGAHLIIIIRVYLFGEELNFYGVIENWGGMCPLCCLWSGVCETTKSGILVS